MSSCRLGTRTLLNPALGGSCLHDVFYSVSSLARGTRRDDGARYACPEELELSFGLRPALERRAPLSIRHSGELRPDASDEKGVSQINYDGSRH